MIYLRLFIKYTLSILISKKGWKLIQINRLIKNKIINIWIISFIFQCKTMKISYLKFINCQFYQLSKKYPLLIFVDMNLQYRHIFIFRNLSDFIDNFIKHVYIWLEWNIFKIGMMKKGYIIITIFSLNLTIINWDWINV